MAKTDGRGAARRSARDRLAAERAAEERRRRRRRVATLAAYGSVAAALIAGSIWAATSREKPGQGKTTASHRTPPPSTAAGAEAGRPPWPHPDDTADRARAEGLAVAPMEGTAQHFHTHLDILVGGKAVPVAANLGIAASGDAMAELHTHDTSGVLHIEAPTTGKRYTLGQLFTEWNVRLSAAALGGLKADATRTLTAYVDGRKQAGDPATIELTPHREIALVYGPANSAVRVPSRYDFQPGE